MQVAFLYKEICPNYELDAPILKIINLLHIKSYISSGIWYFFDTFDSKEQINKRIIENNGD